ncbi:MAG: AlkA N-terminal domain-containing protein, partial [Solirubrobacteraceae bacterium]
SLRLPHGAGIADLRPSGTEGYVRARYWLEDLRDLAPAVQRSRGLIDLDSDPHAVVEPLEDDELLGPLVRAMPGRRVIGHVDPSELAVRAVLGQQVSLAGATTLARRPRASPAAVARTPRNRRLDSRLHPDARAPRSRCVHGHRPRRPLRARAAGV